ncbi:MAG: sulfatase-like hydrolase/transferase [Gammaproteobacteria bacterium]|nr:sulfatase-like hydrolase/transferase [Gammaproteobacteria bacterium]
MASGPRGALPALRAIAALLFLNVALSFNTWWPTPWVKPDARLAPELVALWLVLLVAVKVAGEVSRRLVAVLAAVYVLLVVGRYADVTAPALFGRPLNLYSDGRQIPRFLAVVSQHHAPWELGLVALAALFGLWALYRLLRLAIGTVGRDLAPRALRSRAALALTALAAALVVANAAGVKETWPIVARPVAPTYLRQAELLVTAFSPRLLAARLPPSPPFRSDLGALGGRDVKILFLESYGATVFDDPGFRNALAPSRAALERGIAAGGRQVVSAFVRSPTFGGASDLAHLGLLSGLDLGDPLRHDLLLTTRRPTLLTLFRARGYETYGFYPALSWEWPERAFYGFDHFLDGPGLGYRGPHFGLWWIPDQYAIARFDELNPIGPDSPPRLLFFPTITTHIPFRPVPPYQPDWARLLTADPFDAAETARALADEIDWLDLPPAYARSIEYTYTWLAGYLARPPPRDDVVILVGDHQPASSVSGEGAPWDVPVHVIASDDVLLERLRDAGFATGLEPRRPGLGAMHDLTRVLLDAFDSDGPAPPTSPRIPQGLRLADPRGGDETSEEVVRGVGS